MRVVNIRVITVSTGKFCSVFLVIVIVCGYGYGAFIQMKLKVLLIKTLISVSRLR